VVDFAPYGHESARSRLQALHSHAMPPAAGWRGDALAVQLVYDTIEEFDSSCLDRGWGLGELLAGDVISLGRPLAILQPSALAAASCSMRPIACAGPAIVLISEAIARARCVNDGSPRTVAAAEAMADTDASLGRIIVAAPASEHRSALYSWSAP
jgi:hypothetical protein